MDSNLLYGSMFGGAGLIAAIAAVVINFVGVTGIGKYAGLAMIFIAAYVFHLIFLSLLQAEACSGLKSGKSIALGALLGAGIVAICVALPLHMDGARLAFSDLFFTHYALLTDEVRSFANKFVSVMKGGANEKMEFIAAPPEEGQGNEGSPLQGPLPPTLTDPPPEEGEGQRSEGSPLQRPLPPTLTDPPPAQPGPPPFMPGQQQQQPSYQNFPFGPLAFKNTLEQKLYDLQTVKEATFAGPIWAFLAGAIGIGAGNLISGSQC